MSHTGIEGEQVNQGQRAPGKETGLRQSSPQAGGVIKGRQGKQRPPHLKRGMGVGPGGAGQVMFGGKLLRLKILLCGVTAGVEDFDGVDQRGNFQQVGQGPAAALTVKGV